MTPLARALALMQASPDDDARRLAFFHEVAASELHVLGGETPEVFQTSNGPVLMAFDTEEALADFAQSPVDRASLPGRMLARAVQGHDIALTLYTGAGQTLLDAATLTWLADLSTPETAWIDAHLSNPSAPRDLPPPLLAALDRAFPRMAGLARRAWLFETDMGLVLALEGAAAGAEPALSQSIAEAIRFSDWNGSLDVTFVDSEQAERLKGHALRIDMPEPPSRPEKPKDEPPRLR